MNVTVGPGTYRVGLRFAERRAGDDPSRRAMNVSINGRTVAEGLDVAARAGGDGKALDLTFEDIRPQDGVIEIRLAGTDGGEAMVQAVEVARVSAVGARGSEK